MATVLRTEPYNDGSGLVTVEISDGGLDTVLVTVHDYQMSAPDWQSTVDAIAARLLAKREES